MPRRCPAHEQDDPFAFVSDESDSDVSSKPSASSDSTFALCHNLPFKLLDSLRHLPELDTFIVL
jgi:hypothetical protein